MKIFCFLFALLLAGCYPYSNRFDRGIQNFRKHDYRAAFIMLKPQALKGNPEAEYAVGYMYYYGQGVVENKGKARYWIEKAAKHGQGEAITALTLMNRKPTPIVLNDGPKDLTTISHPQGGSSAFTYY